MKSAVLQGVLVITLLIGMGGTSTAQNLGRLSLLQNQSYHPSSDSSISTKVPGQPEYLNAWGIDLLISSDGFGLGGFYRREFTEDLFGFVSFSISESKDEREMERFDLYTQRSFVPGKLNRFMVMPLMFGVQKRLFKDDIMDTFRPYINAAVGPTMIYVSPFVDIITYQTGTVEIRQVEFFNSLGRGHPEYTASAYIGAGANFGSEKSNLLGVNFRYYFTYLFGDGLPSIYAIEQNAVRIASTRRSFGGFFITLNIGMTY
jgi:hypothetical protein